MRSLHNVHEMYKTTWRHNPEELQLHSKRFDKMRSMGYNTEFRPTQSRSLGDVRQT